MKLENQIEQANKAIKNARQIQKATSMLLSKRKNRIELLTVDLKNLDKIMGDVTKITTKSIQRAKLQNQEQNQDCSQ